MVEKGGVNPGCRGFLYLLFQWGKGNGMNGWEGMKIVSVVSFVLWDVALEIGGGLDPFVVDAFELDLAMGLTC